MMLPAVRSTSTKSLAIFILALAVTAAVPASPQDETVPETPLQVTPIAEGVPTESGAAEALAQVQATNVKGIEDANHPDKLINLRKGDIVKIVTHLVEQGAINRQKLENSLQESEKSLQATEKSLQATEEGLQATEDENALLADKNTHLVDENAQLAHKNAELVDENAELGDQMSELEKNAQPCKEDHHMGEEENSQHREETASSIVDCSFSSEMRIVMGFNVLREAAETWASCAISSRSFGAVDCQVQARAQYEGMGGNPAEWDSFDRTYAQDVAKGIYDAANSHYDAFARRRAPGTRSREHVLLAAREETIDVVFRVEAACSAINTDTFNTDVVQAVAEIDSGLIVNSVSAPWAAATFECQMKYRIKKGTSTMTVAELLTAATTVSVSAQSAYPALCRK